MRAIDAHTFVDAVQQKLHAIRGLVADYQRDLPEATCQGFVGGIHTLLDAVDAFHNQRVAYCNMAFAGDESERDQQLRIYSKAALKILANIHEGYLSFLRGGIQQNEYLILPSILRGIHLFERNVEVTLVPQFEYNYGFLGYQDFVTRSIRSFEKYLDESTRTRILERVKALPKWTAFVLYPVADKDSALNLAVLVHELAHLVDQTRLLYKNFLPMKLDEKSFTELVEELCAAPSPAAAKGRQSDRQLTLELFYTREEIEARAFQTSSRMVESWLRELIADILGTHALGPAYFFAFCEYLAHSALENEPDAQHDAPANRLGIVLKELEFLGYLKCSNELQGLLTKAKAAIEADALETRYEAHSQVANKTLEQNLPKVLSNLREFMKPYSYTADKYTIEVPGVVETLRRGVAPIETLIPSQDMPTANSVVGIINAGWQLYKCQRDAFFSLFADKVSSQERLINLNQLLFKAIEASEVVRMWRGKKL